MIHLFFRGKVHERILFLCDSDGIVVEFIPLKKNGFNTAMRRAMIRLKRKKYISMN